MGISWECRIRLRRILAGNRTIRSLHCPAWSGDTSPPSDLPPSRTHNAGRGLPTCCSIADYDNLVRVSRFARLAKPARTAVDAELSAMLHFVEPDADHRVV
jgi:hypothetical protein